MPIGLLELCKYVTNNKETLDPNILYIYHAF